MRTILELAAILLGSLVIGCTVTWLVRAPWRKRETPLPAPSTRIYEYRIRFNGSLIMGELESSVAAASLALHGCGKTTVRGMTARERRLERRLCEREKELIRVQLHCAWYFERWCLATSAVRGLASVVADLHRVRRDVARRARAAA